MDFETWPLHDAVLREVVVDWAARKCCMRVYAFVKQDESAVPCTLIWGGVKHVDIPIRMPWGPSVHINSQRLTASELYSIEVQSGDMIVIEASSATFDRDSGLSE